LKKPANAISQVAPARVVVHDQVDAPVVIAAVVVVALVVTVATAPVAIVVTDDKP